MPRVDRAAIVELARRADLAPADHQRVAPAERRAHAVDGGVQLAMEILHPIAAHRRVGDFDLSHCLYPPSRPPYPSYQTRPTRFPRSGSLRNATSGAICRKTPSRPL